MAYLIASLAGLSNTYHSVQSASSCSPNGTACYSGMATDSLGCRVSCTGLYADADVREDTLTDKHKGVFQKLQADYTEYKRKYVRIMLFDPTQLNLSIILLNKSAFRLCVRPCILSVHSSVQQKFVPPCSRGGDRSIVIISPNVHVTTTGRRPAFARLVS